MGEFFNSNCTFLSIVFSAEKLRADVNGFIIVGVLLSTFFLPLFWRSHP